MDSLKAFLNSRKTIAGLFATILIGIPIFFNWSTWTMQQRQQQVTQAVYMIAAIWGIHIAATAYEDGKEKSNGTPDTQVNVSSEVQNTAAQQTAKLPAAVVQPLPQQLQPSTQLTVTVKQLQDLAKASALQAAAAVVRQPNVPPTPTPEQIADAAEHNQST